MFHHTNTRFPIRHYTLALVALMLLAGVTLGACSVLPSINSNPQKSQQQVTPTPLPTPIIPSKQIYTVQRGEVISEVKFIGHFVPVNEQDLFFRVGGRVKEVLVMRGDEVKKGQVLARLEGSGPDPFEVQRAQVNLEIAKLELELTKTQVFPWDKQYPIQVGIREKQVELAQIEVNRLGDAGAAAEIASTIDGTVTTVSILPGSTAEAYMPLIMVADLTQLEISSDLTVNQLAQVEVGLKVQVVSPLGGGQAATGTVRSLPNSPSVQTSPQDIQIDVRIALDQTPSDLGYNLGDQVNMVITLEKKENVLWLPPQAVRDFSGRKFVIVQDASGQHRLDVKLGIQNEDRVEIMDGLTEGQIVVSQ